jgi:hypothetical protein
VPSVTGAGSVGATVGASVGARVGGWVGAADTVVAIFGFAVGFTVVGTVTKTVFGDFVGFGAVPAGGTTATGAFAAFGGAIVDDATVTTFSTIFSSVIVGTGAGRVGTGFVTFTGATVATVAGIVTTTAVVVSGATVEGTSAANAGSSGNAATVAAEFEAPAATDVAGIATMALRPPGRKPSQPRPVIAEAVTTPDITMVIVVAEKARAVLRFIVGHRTGRHNNKSC